MTERTSIAVVGVSAIFPGSVDVTGFWRDLLNGNDLISDVPPTHWLVEDYYDADPKAPDKTYANRGAFLPNVDFDPMEWGIPPNIVPATDTAQLLALIVAKRVLEDATRGDLGKFNRDRTSVILGVTSAQELLASMVSRLQRPIWEKALREMGLGESQVIDACKRIGDHYVSWQESSFPGLLGNVVAGRIANRLDLGGTNCVTDAACASTLSALSMGINELRLGQSDLVIAGGVDTMNDIFMYMCFSKTPALSASGDCRPFSDAADGTMLGEGIGMVALKRHEDAMRDRDPIYAVIRGLGSSSDGRAKSVYAPLPEGQAKALRRAYEAAGYGPETVELVEAHGTGTKAGDAAEFGGLEMVFNEAGRADRQWCALGSVKSQIGHTKAAAGAAGLVKTVLALHQKVLPPTIKIDRPNPKLAIEASPFYLNTEARPWISGAKHPRRASVSSFGFGGSNFHVALEEYVGPSAAKKKRALSSELITLSAVSADALARQCRELAQIASAEDMLSFLALDTQTRFDPNAHARAGIVAKDEADLVRKLGTAADLAARGENVNTPDGIALGFGPRGGQVAFLFPGQGSQYVGMGRDLAMTFDAARAAWDFGASAGLKSHAIVHPRPVFDDDARRAQEAVLRATENAQPALGVNSLALLGVLRAIGIEPAALAGHSFGEVVALHASGALTARDMLTVAETRGALMRDAARGTSGSMTAASADAQRLTALLAREGIRDVVIANDNAPNQVVLSGETRAIENVEQVLSNAGIRARRLPVATAFHSKIVAGSVPAFEQALAGIDVSAPRIPVFGNHAERYLGDADAVRRTLAHQIANPVRFVDQIRAMHDAGVRTFVEVGAGSVLTGLASRILGDRPHATVALDRRGADGVTMLHRGLARLAAAGVPMRPAALFNGFELPLDPREKKQPKLSISINGSNHGKPYPPKDGAAGRPGPNPDAPALTPPSVSPNTSTSTALSLEADHISAPISGAAAPDDKWLAAYLEIQRSTAQAHSDYQRMMVDAHQSFLQATQASMLAMLDGSGVEAPAAALPAVTVPAEVKAPTAPTLPGTPTSRKRDEDRVAAASIIPEDPSSNIVTAAAIELPRVEETPVAPSSLMSALQAQPAPVAAAPASGLTKVLLEVVADKTGYPEEMLGLEMDLEADLGVDSIKRVEILSAMRERVPSLPEVDPAELGQMRTLGEIVARYEGAPVAVAAAAPIAAPAALAPAPSLAPVVPSAGSHLGEPAPVATSTLTPIMLEIVAEKTGYPSEMLGLEMDLEADLGVDSIKRVEILSAMRERVPSLPEVDPAELGQMRTLGEIVARYEGSGIAAPAAAPVPAAPAAPAVAAPAPAAASTLTPIMLEIVAEKTGYPAEMLGLEMDLEADLGVDSIKRVEILSAMRERVPSLPEVDPAELGQMRTLGEIVARYEGPGAVHAAPAAAPVATPASAASVAAPASAEASTLTPIMLEIVAEKTGYPAEMLGLEMDLEADLGVDSIKRVEILSAMRERVPSLPEVDPAELGQMRTLGEIVARYEGPTAAPTSPTQQVTAVAVPAILSPSALAQSAPTASAAPSTLTPIMLEIVAEKTGYPAEMLGLDMDLEADLGVDSIKRVEILSAMRERVPSLPEVDPAELGQMRTLAEIVARYEGPTAPAPAVTSAPPPAPSDSTELYSEEPTNVLGTRNAAVTLTPIMLDIVAEKTGYPAEMIGLDMDLEADLGVDSIKRVEILSAVRERVPSLPEVDPSELGQMRTLAQIVARYEGPAPAVAAAPISASTLLASTPGEAYPHRVPRSAPTQSAPQAEPDYGALTSAMLEVVAEKTGYPAEMLGLDMDLEADLGVDSIKRVEILSALRERRPDLPEVDPAVLGQLRTLGEIVSTMDRSATVTLPSATGVLAPSPASALPQVARFELSVAPAPATGLAIPGIFTSPLILLNDGDGVAQALFAYLRDFGVAAEVHDTVPNNASAVVFLGAIRTGLDVASALSMNAKAFACAKALAPRLSTIGGLFVTVQDTGGDFGLSGSSRAWASGIPGLVKTAAQEWPKASVRAIDIDRAGRSIEHVAKAIGDELLHGGVGLEIGLRADGSRVTLKSTAATGSTGAIALGKRDVVVASGGARGVTAACLIELARSMQGRFLLLGRTPLFMEPDECRDATTDAELKRALLEQAKRNGEKITPRELGKTVRRILAAREVRETLQTIRTAGGEARYAACDVTDAADVSRVLAQARTDWGRIDAFVHGAGVLADRLIVDKTDEQFNLVFNTKVRGLVSLLHATRDDALKVIASFSSIAGRTGNQGQCDYAMANEVLNRVMSSEAARRSSCVVKSFGWGPWESGMVTPALREKFLAAGVPLIGLADGARRFVAELTRAREAVELVIGPTPQPGALAGAAPRPVELAVRVHRAHHPYLTSHQVKGTPVLPMVMVLDWFTTAAEVARPDDGPAEVFDFKMLRGVTLDSFESAGDVFRVRATQVGDEALLELHDEQGTVRYSAKARFGKLKRSFAPKASRLPSLAGPVYDGRTLFHGPDFQVLEGQPSVADEGAEAISIGVEGKGWRGSFHTDPALLDGGLQLALLWTRHVIGGSALPTAFESFRVHERGWSGPTRISLRARAAGGDRAISDLVFVASDGRVVFELTGVETFVLPGSRSAGPSARA